ncbi:hypothetical protein AALC25_06230 [Lachnospiraceae bacterium 29-84]
MSQSNGSRIDGCYAGDPVASGRWGYDVQHILRSAYEKESPNCLWSLPAGRPAFRKYGDGTLSVSDTNGKTIIDTSDIDCVDRREDLPQAGNLLVQCYVSEFTLSLCRFGFLWFFWKLNDITRKLYCLSDFKKYSVNHFYVGSFKSIAQDGIGLLWFDK